jgi:acetyl esterase
MNPLQDDQRYPFLVAAGLRETVLRAKGNNKSYIMRVPMEEIIYTQTAEGDLRVRIYKPETQTTDRPAVVFYFGGGWNKGNLDQFKTHSEHLAKHGMVCVCAEYRVKALHGTSPIACVEDGRSAFRWVKSQADNLGIDPTRIAVGGGSAGGHIALCVLLANGVNATEDDLSIECDPSLLLLFNPVGDMVSRADRFENEGEARSVSPIHLLDDRSGPSIMFYGSDDVMIEEGRALLEKSRSIGVESELHIADGEKHTFFNRSPWLESTTDLTHGFLHRHGYVTATSDVVVDDAARMHEDALA